VNRVACRSMIRSRIRRALAISALLVPALVAPPLQAQLPGQLIVDPEHPQWLKAQGGDNVFLAGVGDPEDFFYRGTRNADGTRDGDQDALIDKLIAEGGNTLYVEVVRSHGGDGPPDHNPFVNSDETLGLDQDILDQWEGWLQRCDDNGIYVYMFFYDDTTRVWSTGNGVFGAELAFLQAIVDAFEHHPNILWFVAEESEEAHSESKVNNIANAIRAADDHDHLIGNHHHSGDDFKAWFDGSVLQHFGMHLDVSAAAVHQGTIDARDKAEAAGAGGNGYFATYTEVLYLAGASDAVLRTYLWDVAMGGMQPLIYGADIANTSNAVLNDCRNMSAFFEATDFQTMKNRDELARAGTTYVLANPPSSYIAYADGANGDLGLGGMSAGFHDLLWMDLDTGTMVMQTGVSTGNGDVQFARPVGVGDECAVWVRRAWFDVGFPLAGSNGLPQLEIESSMIAGEPFTLRLTDAKSSSFVYNVVGFSRITAPFEGGTMVPSVDLIVPGGTNALGTQLIQTPFPPGFPSGASTWIQCWLVDAAGVYGYSSSNGLQGTAP